MPLSPDFPINLKRLLDKAGASREAIARRVDVSRATIYNWQDGKGGPDEEQAARLAKELNVPVGEFWIPEAPIAPSQQERLAQLESFARRFRDFAREVDDLLLDEQDTPVLAARRRPPARTDAPGTPEGERQPRRRR